MSFRQNILVPINRYSEFCQKFNFYCKIHIDFFFFRKHKFSEVVGLMLIFLICEITYVSKSMTKAFIFIYT